MPKETIPIGKEVLLILFKGPQLLGKIILEESDFIEIETKGYGTKKIKKGDIKKIKE